MVSEVISLGFFNQFILRFALMTRKMLFFCEMLLSISGCDRFHFIHTEGRFTSPQVVEQGWISAAVVFEFATRLVTQ